MKNSIELFNECLYELSKLSIVNDKNRHIFESFEDSKNILLESSIYLQKFKKPEATKLIKTLHKNFGLLHNTEFYKTSATYAFRFMSGGKIVIKPPNQTKSIVIESKPDETNCLIFDGHSGFAIARKSSRGYLVYMSHHAEPGLGCKKCTTRNRFSGNEEEHGEQRDQHGLNCNLKNGVSSIYCTCIPCDHMYWLDCSSISELKKDLSSIAVRDYYVSIFNKSTAQKRMLKANIKKLEFEEGNRYQNEKIMRDQVSEILKTNRYFSFYLVKEFQRASADLKGRAQELLKNEAFESAIEKIRQANMLNKYAASIRHLHKEPISKIHSEISKGELAEDEFIVKRLMKAIRIASVYLYNEQIKTLSYSETLRRAPRDMDSWEFGPQIKIIQEIKKGNFQVIYPVLMFFKNQLISPRVNY